MPDTPAPYPVPGAADLRSLARALVEAAAVQIAEDRERRAEVRASRG